MLFIFVYVQQFNDFDLEHHDECMYDHVKIYDGDDASDRSLGRYCGSRIPDPIISSSNRMYMVFYSDASLQKKGFRATHTTGKRCVLFVSYAC